MSAREKAEAKAQQQALDMQMLMDGIQRLEWGTTRLVDVAMAPGPPEATLDPLVEGSELLCVRLCDHAIRIPAPALSPAANACAQLGVGRRDM